MRGHNSEPFNTTVFRLHEELSSKEIVVEIFEDRLRPHESRLRHFYASLKPILQLPFGLLAAVEWGYGPQGINTDGSRGTHVVRLTTFKIF